VKLVREAAPTQSVQFRAEGDTGYLRVDQFTDQTSSELQAAIDHLQSEIGGDKVQGYVLDLRNNPGGVFHQAIAVSDLFLDHGEIVSSRGRGSKAETRYDATGDDHIAGNRLVVLINGGSASATEIVAGALQDDHRATLIGTRSFGDGSLQTLIPLGANGALQLTTARYYTPSGRSIALAGIGPDTVVEEDPPPDLVKTAPPATDSSLHSAATKASRQAGDAISGYIPDDPKKDKQLAYALDLLRGSVLPAPLIPRGQVN
jgi:carboxyl-terminal processing protease